MLRIRAGAVHPVTAPPIEDGAVLVDDRGTIVAVGPERGVPTPDGAARYEFPAAMLVPGLVNTHTHLELTHLAGRTVERAFAPWIRSIRALKDATPPDAFRRAAEAGLRACWAAGVTCVADTGSSGAPLRALAALAGRGIAFHEVFGPDPAQAEASLDALAETLGQLGGLASGQVRLGVSPHAPYTVSAALYRAVAELARAWGLPLALHLAESREETELVREGRGPFADALRARGIAVEPTGCSPVQYVAALGALGPRTLCIHCVQLDASDIRTLGRAGVSVAHCPRSNRAHGHGAAPLAALRQAGVQVGLGTDSVVSVGDVNLWAEARAAELAPGDALRMLTLEGARALGLAAEIGSLDVGKQGDLAVFAALPPGSHAALGPALLTAVAGRVVHG